MHINIYEWGLDVTNLLFLIVAITLLYKRFYLVAIPFFMISLFSSLYHICYSPLHITLDTQLSFFFMCPINDSRIYGMTLMFLDIFFATSCVSFLFVFVLPIYKEKNFEDKMFDRYIILI